MKYPLYREDRGRIKLPSGRPIDEFSAESLEAGRLGAEDLGIHAETLRQQAAIAEEAGFPQLARNLARAAELTRLPEKKILEIYETLRRRPGDGGARGARPGGRAGLRRGPDRGVHPRGGGPVLVEPPQRSPIPSCGSHCSQRRASSRLHRRPGFRDIPLTMTNPSGQSAPAASRARSISRA